MTFLAKTVAGIFEDTMRPMQNLSLSLGEHYYWQNYFHGIPWMSVRASASPGRRTLASAEAGNWFNFGTAISIYSGKPVDVTTGNDENRDGWQSTGL